MMVDIDYEKMMIDDTYDLIINRKNPWPVNWTRARKIQLIDRIINFYTEKDEYEKCTVLQNKRKEIMNATSKKSSPGK